MPMVNDVMRGLRARVMREARQGVIRWMLILTVAVIALGVCYADRKVAGFIVAAGLVIFSAAAVGGHSSVSGAYKLGWSHGVESEHYFDEGNSHGPISTPSGWIDADARCVCGAPWLEGVCGRYLYPPEVCGYPSDGSSLELLDADGMPLRCTRPAGHDLIGVDGDPQRANHSHPDSDWMWRTRLRARDAR